MGKEMENEIGAMNKMTDALRGTSAPGTDNPGTDAPGTDAPTTEVPDDLTTDAPSTDGASTNAPSTDAPTTEAPDELALAKAKIIELENAAKTTNAPSTDAPSTDAPVIDEDFIGDVDLEDLMNNKEDFNKLLNTVFKKGVEAAKQLNLDGSEGVLKAIPQIVKTNISIITSLKKASEEFYDDNKDLVPFKKVVAAVFEEQVAANPDKTYSENLKVVGPEVRKRLELTKKAIKKDKKKSPKLPGNKGSKRVTEKPDTKGITSEIDAMNNSINN